MNHTKQRIFLKLLSSYLLLFLIWTLFSFVFTDPNLILINHQYFLNYQTYLWQNILPNNHLRISLYVFLIMALIINYFYLIKFWPQKINYSNKKIIFVILGILFLLIISYNALSHDVFNYIFNARILVKYGANPHLVVAQRFSDDPWLRFMHNTHTPAPYGQAWTLISIVPYLLGFTKFLTTWLSFKVFALLGMILAYFCLKKLIKKDHKSPTKLALLFFNPLILLETIGNAHNDWWMMWPVLASFILIDRFKTAKQSKLFYLVAVCVLMFFSILTKYASLIAIPFLLYYLLKDQLNKLAFFKNKYLNQIKFFFDKYFWDLLSISFFLPLLTARSQRFLTWYLIWPMTFLPLLKSRWWQNTLVVFSLSALLSYLVDITYIPWLYFDQPLPNVLLLKQWLLWLPPLIYNGLFLIKKIGNNAKN